MDRLLDLGKQLAAQTKSGFLGFHLACLLPIKIERSRQIFISHTKKANEFNTVTPTIRQSAHQSGLRGNESIKRLLVAQVTQGKVSIFATISSLHHQSAGR